MKTSKVIGLLCTAISGLNDALLLVNGSIVDDGKINNNEALSSNDYSHVHSILSPGSEMVRELWNELPESLRDEESSKLVFKLYPHLYQDDYAEMTAVVREVHGLIYAMWQTMSDRQESVAVYA